MRTERFVKLAWQPLQSELTFPMEAVFQENSSLLPGLADATRLAADALWPQLTEGLVAPLTGS